MLIFKINFIKKFFQQHNIRMPNGLDPNQDWFSVGPDLVPICLQMLPADTIIRC